MKELKKIFVTVKPNSKKESVEVLGENEYLVRVNASPVKGEANQKVQKALAKFLGVPQTALELIRGFKGKQKIFKIN